MRIAIALLAAAVVPALAAQAPTLMPGQYEVVSELAPPGGTAVGPPRKDLRCYTEKDVENIANIVTQRDAAKGKCHVVSSKVAGKTLTFTTECPNDDGRGALTLSGKFDFVSQESYHAVVDMKSTGERGGRSDFPGMTVTMNAKRIGTCPK
jgi:hypothetical protein